MEILTTQSVKSNIFVLIHASFHHCSVCMSELSAAYRRRYAATHAPTTTCTVVYRNMSDMCGFLVFMLIKRCCVCLLPQQPNFPREQLQNSSVLYLPSLQSGDIHVTSDYPSRWVRLQHVCRAHRLHTVTETSSFLNICS